MIKQSKGITLIALVITIIILLILAGVSISTLGENGLFKKAKMAKNTQIKSEMREQLAIKLSELQVEKNGEATLSDINQDWATTALNEYKATVTEGETTNVKKVTMQKNGVIGNYAIDEKLNIIETEENTEVELTYEVKSREGENLQVSVIITNSKNGLKTIEYDDGYVQNADGVKSVTRDCTIQLGVKYKVKIVSTDGKEKTEVILINDYYQTVTKNLEKGIKIDNNATKTAYNKPYQATITTEDDIIIESLIVTMGGQVVTTSEKNIIDIATGKIYIEKVTGDITITGTIAEKINFKDNLVDYWDLKDSLKNKIGNDNLVANNESNLKFQDESVYLNDTVLTTKNNYKLPENFTITFKYKPTEPLKSWTLILGKISQYASLETYNGLFIHTDKNTVRLCTSVKTSNYFAINEIVTVGTYSTLSITYDGTTSSLYRDGNLITQVNGYRDLDDKLYIGGSMYSGTNAAGYQWNYANGYFKDIKIYNIALTQEQLNILK